MRQVMSRPLDRFSDSPRLRGNWPVLPANPRLRGGGGGGTSLRGGRAPALAPPLESFAAMVWIGAALRKQRQSNTIIFGLPSS